MYELKDEFLTGVTTLDEEHREIFRLTDEAYLLLKDENILYKEEEVEKIVSGIFSYIEKHFKDEETYMEEIGFSGLEEQKEQHKQFAEKLDEFKQTLKDISLKNQDEILLNLLDYLANWLQQHICHSDMKYCIA